MERPQQRHQRGRRRGRGQISVGIDDRIARRLRCGQCIDGRRVGCVQVRVGDNDTIDLSQFPRCQRRQVHKRIFGDDDIGHVTLSRCQGDIKDLGNISEHGGRRRRVEDGELFVAWIVKEGREIKDRVNKIGTKHSVFTISGEVCCNRKNLI